MRMSNLFAPLAASLILLVNALFATASDVITPTVPQGEPLCDDYAVTVDGLEAPVWRCRVSAQPFNRIWPGYQRSLDQTELSGFATWQTNEKSNRVVVTVKRDDVSSLDDVVVRPLSLGIVPEIDAQKREIAFDVPGAAPIVVEVNGFHRALHLLPTPIYEKPQDLNAPNLRYFGPGVHNVGRIDVKSGDEIFIDAGAVVYGGIHGKNVENVTISGPGILDGAPFERGQLNGLFLFNACRNITIDGVLLRDPDAWGATFARCDGLTIRRARLVGFWRYNADGIDLCNSKNILVENSFLRTFDDSLVVKGLGKTPFHSIDGAIPIDGLEENSQSAENILLRNNVIWCDWGRAMEIGAETSAPEMKNIRFENSDIIRTTHIAMDIQHGDRAKISDVVFSDVRVEFDAQIPTPIYQNSDDQVYDPNADPNYCPELGYVVIYKGPWSVDKENGTVENVRFENIRVFGERKPRFVFLGLDPEHDVKNATLENVVVGDQKLSDENGLLPVVANEFVSGLEIK